MSADAATFTDADPRHGTYSGVQAHSYYKTPYCDQCKEARRLYTRQLRLSKASKRSVTFPIATPLDDFDGLGASIARSFRESA